MFCSCLGYPSITRALAVAVLLLSASWLGCGGDDDDSNAAGGAVDSGGPARSGACELGCESTIYANCSMGPTTQLECETDCERLRNGTCGNEYRAYMSCGDGEKVSCDAMGFPVVAACPDERAAFVDCLN